jgi:glycosyltransferase involved in cell wall biosynthesis
MATVVQSLTAGLGASYEVRVLNNVKTTPPGRTLLAGVWAQAVLLARLLRELSLWRPALVHLHTCSDLTFWRSALDLLLARLFLRRVVLHVHGGRFVRFLEGLGAGLRAVARFVLHSSDRVVVLGEEWERALRPWCRPDRVVVVPNGVRVPTPAPLRDLPAPRVLCVAALHPDKGQRDLLRALARSEVPPEATVTFLGDEAAPGEREELSALARTLMLEGRVSAPGVARGASLDRYLAQAEVFCLPSYYEGLPMAVLEAMAAGLPVVVSRVGSIPDVVRDGLDGYLFEPGDVPVLAERLSRLLRDPERARAMGAAARARVAERFSLERAEERVRAVYEDLGVAPRNRVPAPAA